MVSFSCEGCGDVLTKKKLQGHQNQCHAASFTCLDCMTHFSGNSYKSHTSCISEDQKYQGKLYKEKKPKGQHQKKDSAQQDNSQALTPHNAYVEDATEADNAIAIVDAPPRAPTPPPAAHSLGYHEQAAIEDYNVFDFLEPTDTPNVPRTQEPIDESRMIEDRQPPAYDEQYTPAISDVMKFQLADDDETFAQTGFTYGDAPVRPSSERYDSYTTPAPKPKHARTKSRDTDVETTTKKKTDRKRKRNSPAELDMSLVRAQEQRDTMMADAPPMLHSGLTGGLNRLLARPEFPPSPEDSGDYANSPLSPMKRAKQGNSKALLRAQRDYEAQQLKQRKADIKEQMEREEKEKKKEKKAKERGRERDRKERQASTALVKVRPKKRREDSNTEIRRIRRRQYSSSVSPPPRERQTMRAIEYNPSVSRSPSPNGDGQLIVRPAGHVVSTNTGGDPRADLFMSFITKGPESERGMSVNKALKRYHRERQDHRDRAPSKGEEEKELWKNMRLKRNDRGEIVLFFSAPETS
ncbi:hypothetical protein EK21DRAFT_85941 [Setomelanomma holmii]|uniref:Zinc finger C2H2 LYAR-type domain-containing protein n=1 Tax=Setomelanomma holmii TaxID=210430 RepID=A0A9P4LRJ0_9PLEO|nr:hypothetical protein EK21DRAFT_85941 [Setomelanomma holmii]